MCLRISSEMSLFLWYKGVPAKNIYLISILVREVTGSNSGNPLLFMDISLKSIIHCAGAHRYHVLTYIH